MLHLIQDKGVSLKKTPAYEFYPREAPTNRGVYMEWSVRADKGRI